MAVCFISKQIGRIACALKTKFLTVDFVFLKRLSLSRNKDRSEDVRSRLLTSDLFNNRSFVERTRFPSDQAASFSDCIFLPAFLRSTI